MKRLAPILAAIALTAPACVPSEGCEPGDEEPTLDLGKGVTEYLTMAAEGGGLEVIHGPQGGYHVEVGFEATYLDASEDWTIQLTGTAGDASASSTPFVTMRCNAQTGTLQSWGHLLIWDAEGADLDGRTADISAVATDAAGTGVSGEVSVELFYPES
ncbi:MAG: hypothetical protein GY898_33610 [Proteobacteria bacterium]|nr:hypothetical protein [Pseudomonadota bacterium]